MARYPANILNDLNEYLDSFLGWLECNRKHFIRTGYPETKYDGPRWLEECLGHLYPVKQPLRGRNSFGIRGRSLQPCVPVADGTRGRHQKQPTNEVLVRHLFRFACH